MKYEALEDVGARKIQFIEIKGQKKEWGRPIWNPQHRKRIVEWLSRLN